MTKPKQMTISQRTYWGLAVDAMRRLEWDQSACLIEEGDLPAGWDEIWNMRGQRDTTRKRVTIRLDADLVKFFQAMGPGYQPRMNAVLRAFMYFRLAGVVEGPESGLNAVRFEREADQKAALAALQQEAARASARNRSEGEIDYDKIRADIGAQLDRIRVARGWDVGGGGDGRSEEE